MILEGKKVTLRKLVASEGKVFVSKELDEEGTPTVKSKEVYLAENGNEEDFIEVDE